MVMGAIPVPDLGHEVRISVAIEISHAMMSWPVGVGTVPKISGILEPEVAEYKVRPGVVVPIQGGRS